MENFGTRLRLLRRSRNLSLDELSALTGIGAKTLERIEKRGIRPSLKTVKKIAAALNILPDVLFGEMRRKQFRTTRRNHL